MSAKIADIADAVTTAINAAASSLITGGFTAVRKYRPVYQLADLDGLHVTVLPRAQESIERTGRDKDQIDFSIDVAVQHRMESDATNEEAFMDAVMDLADKIVAQLRHKNLDSVGALWIGHAADPPYVPEHLEQYRVGTAVRTLTYRVIA